MNHQTVPLKETRLLRIKGEFAKALTLINNLLREYPQEPSVLVEAIRLSLILEENQQASKLYTHLQKLPNWQTHLEPEILLRLRLIAKNPSWAGAAAIHFSEGSKWCRTYARDNEDPIFPANLKEWNLACKDGMTTYTFTSQCLSCHEKHQIHVHMSFFIYREYLCPLCLARQYIEYELIKKLVTKRSSNISFAKLHTLREHLGNLRSELNYDSMNRNQFPLLCQYLNIDYIFILNQIILKRLLQK